MSGEVEFDRIAPIYDETRQAPTDEELRVLVTEFEGCRTLLDAGVGTGRFALPLHSLHFEIIGVDLSLEMMRRARVKGIGSLIRADVRRLPLSDDAVDGAFMAHVLQLIPDPRTVLAELGRIARRVVVVQLPEWSDSGPPGPWRRFRRRYRELALELGYRLPERAQRFHHTLEELSAIAPPSAVHEVERPSTEASSLEDRLARWEKRSLLGTPIPPEVHAEILRRLRAELPIDPPPGRHARKTRFLTWPSATLRA
jgi:ubiquinone/menaquinone biosynthesis C-methylase UbiE